VDREAARVQAAADGEAGAGL